MARSETPTDPTSTDIDPTPSVPPQESSSSATDGPVPPSDNPATPTQGDENEQVGETDQAEPVMVRATADLFIVRARAHAEGDLLSADRAERFGWTDQVEPVTT